MAMNLDTAIRLTAQVQGAQNLKGMAAQFQQLNATAQISGRQLDRLYTATQQFSRAAGGSINSLQQQRQALDTLRNAVDPASRRFQLLTRDIEEIDTKLKQLKPTSQAAANSINALQNQRASLIALRNSVDPASQQFKTLKNEIDSVSAKLKSFEPTVRRAANSISALQERRSALIALRDSVDPTTKRFLVLSQGIDTVDAKLKRLQGTSSGLGARGALLAGLAGGVAGVIAAEAAGAARQSIGGIINVGLEAESANIRLKALTDEFGEYNQAQAASARIAQTLRLSIVEAQAGFADLYASLRPTGVTVEELEKAFIGFTAAARNSGATAQESSAALVQLKQALASGVLQGEELRSIREQAPLVAQAIAKEMGVSIGELKKLASEGRVTSDVVLRALARLNETQLDKLNKQFDTGRQAMKDLQVAASNLGIEVSRVFGPTAVSLVRAFTSALQGAADVMGALSNNAASLNRINLQRQANEQAAAQANARFGIFTLNQGAKADFFQQRQQEIFQQLQRQRLQGGSVTELTSDQLIAQQAAERERAESAIRAQSEEREKLARKIESEANKTADLQRRRNDALADHQRKTQEAIAQEQRQQNLQLFDNRMAMDRELFDLRMEQVRRQRDFDDRLRKAQYESVIQRAPEEQRPALRFAYEMEQIFKNVTDSLQGIDDELEKARRDLIDAQAGVRRAQMEQQTRTITTGMPGGAAAGGATVGRLMEAANRNLGLFAGQTEKCADAIRVLFREAGVAIGTTRNAWDKLASGPSLASSFFGSDIGQRITNQQDLRPGDLVGFERTYGKWGPGVQTHVGMYAGDGMMFDHSSRQGLVKRPLSTFAGKFMYGVRPTALGTPSTTAGVGDLTTTLPASQTGVMAAQAEVERLQTRVRALERMRSEVAPQETRLAGITGQTLSLQRLEEINKAFQDFAKATGDRLAYEREYAGLLANDVTPELAREFMELNQITAERSKQLQLQKEFFEHQLKNSNITNAQKDIARQGLELVNQQVMLQQQQVEQVREELRLREQIIEAQRYRQDDRIGRGAIEGVRSYVAEIGTMREATAQLTQQGIRGLEDSLVSLATTGKANWREFTVSVLEGTARMIIQQMVLAPLMRAIGGIGGGVAQSFQMPPQYFLPAGGFSFEGGGYTGSGARSGGMDGRGGFLAMLHPRETVIDHTKANAAGGNTTVVVNINTTTGEQQTQATDADRRRLGQDIAQVVDARLVYHKRQGGMLSGRR